MVELRSDSELVRTRSGLEHLFLKDNTLIIDEKQGDLNILQGGRGEKIDCFIVRSRRMTEGEFLVNLGIGNSHDEEVVLLEDPREVESPELPRVWRKIDLHFFQVPIFFEDEVAQVGGYRSLLFLHFQKHYRGDVISGYRSWKNSPLGDLFLVDIFQADKGKKGKRNQPRNLLGL